MVAKAGAKAFTKKKTLSFVLPIRCHVIPFSWHTHKLRGLSLLNANKEAQRSLEHKRPPCLSFIHSSRPLSTPPTHLPPETMNVQGSPGTVCGERRSVIAFLYLPIKPAYKAFHSLIVSAPDSLTERENGSVGSWQGLSVLGAIGISFNHFIVLLLHVFFFIGSLCNDILFWFAIF